MWAVSRRSLLRAGGLTGATALAGCLPGGRLKRYRVEADVAPRGLPAKIEAEAVRAPSRDHPLVVEVTFISTASKMTDFAVDGPGPFPFGLATAENQISGAGATTQTPSSPKRLVASPRGEAGELIEHCWRAIGTNDEDLETTTQTSLEPGESVTAAIAILNSPNTRGCYPIGEYRFSHVYWSGEAVKKPDEASGSEWGFGLRVSDLRPRR